MKKITLSIGLIATMLSSNAQDTTCTYFTGDKVFEFDYYNNTILYEVKHENRFYEINIEYGDVLCLDLSDDKRRVRKVITEFFDGSIREDILDSKNNIYYSPLGVVKVLVGKPRIKFTK